MDNLAVNAKNQAAVATANAARNGAQQSNGAGGTVFSDFLVFSGKNMTPSMTLSTARVSNENVRDTGSDKSHDQSYASDRDDHASSTRNDDHVDARNDDQNYRRDDNDVSARGDDTRDQNTDHNRDDNSGGNETERSETASSNDTGRDDHNASDTDQNTDTSANDASNATESNAADNNVSDNVTDQAASDAFTQGTVAAVQASADPAIAAAANKANSNTQNSTAKNGDVVSQVASATQGDGKGLFTEGWQNGSAQNKNAQNGQNQQNMQQNAQNANASQQAVDPNALAQNNDNIARQAADLAKKIGLNQRVQVNVSVTDDAANAASLPSQALSNAASVQANANNPLANNGQKNQGQQNNAQAGQNVQAAAINAQAQNTQQSNNQNNQNQSFQNMVGDVKGAAGANAAKIGNIAQPQGANAEMAQTNAATNSNQNTQQSQQTEQSQKSATHKPTVHTTARADEVSVEIAKAAKAGADRINIQLKPAEMGRIDVQLDMSNGKVTATIVAERPETLNMLKNDAAQLAKSLQEAGLDMGNMNFNLQQQQNGDGQQMARSGNGPANSGMTEAASDEEMLLASEMNLLEQRAQASAARGGVDISA